MGKIQSPLQDLVWGGGRGDLATLRSEWPDRTLVEVPSSNVAWIKDPVEDMDFGHKVVRDLSGSGLGVVMLDAD